MNCHMHALHPGCCCARCTFRIVHCRWWYDLPLKGTYVDAICRQSLTRMAEQSPNPSQASSRSSSPQSRPLSPTSARFADACLNREPFFVQETAPVNHAIVPSSLPEEAARPVQLVSSSVTQDDVLPPCTRVELNSDGSSSVHFDWNAATAEDAMSFVTSKVLGSPSRKGMGSYLRQILKVLQKLMEPSSGEHSFFAGLLQAGNKGLASVENNRDFRRHFIAAWDRKKAEAVRAMSFYSTSHPVCLYREGRQGLPENLKPRHGEIDALARVAVLMSFPEVQPMWQEIANESRNRSALDHPDERLVEKNEAIEMVLVKNYFNNAAFTAPCQLSLAPYTTSVVIDPSKPPESPKTLAWFREQKRYLKNVMGHVLVHCVKKTGEGESGADADTRFWKYCHGDALLMFVWLLWGRGHNVPTHCSATLQSDSILDVGARSPDCTKAQSPRSASKTSASTASLLGAIGKFEQVQQSILAQIASKTDGNAMSEKEKRAKEAAALAQTIEAVGSAKRHCAEKDPRGDILSKKQSDLIDQMLSLL
jgi:hypothetical protein